MIEQTYPHSIMMAAIKRDVEAAVKAEREACALVADAMAGDLADRMTDADWKEDITGEQVVNGYRMIGKLIRNRK